MGTREIIADSAGTAPDEWGWTAGPDNKGAPMTAWLVRRKEGAPDVYACVTGDAAPEHADRPRI